MNILELLEQLPATLKLKRVIQIEDDGKTIFQEEPEEFTLYISKVTPEYIKEFDEGEETVKKYPNGAWIILYEFIGFEGRIDCYPIRLEGKILDINEMVNLKVDDLICSSQGLIGDNIEELIEKMLNWIKRNKVA